jgi:hypothetical protein
VILEHSVLGLHTCLVPVLLSYPLLSCIPCLGSALQYILLPYNPLSRALYFNSFLVCITSTSIPASLRCTCFVIARQISPTPCRHSGQTPHRPRRTLRPTDRNTYERNPVPAPTRLVLPDPTISSYYVVRPVENLRYLGFFINRRLKWEPHVRIMCNRARASIKALQVLGNTIRGLSMANRRLVLNAVCLPVLAYGSQLWYLTGAAKGLLKMVQRVQNDMVHQVTGAFRTAPREPLLHLTRMLPMKFFIEKLTYTSALRLYRLPRESQILRRLGEDWYSPGQGDLPLPVPRTCVLPGKRNQRPTVLEALALRVPSEGPKVDVAAIAPWEVPNWVEHVSYMDVETPCV